MSTRCRRSFSGHSAPYLFSTEFPFVHLTRDLVADRRILAIAGSGDIPLHCAGLGARKVVALDVSRRAIHLCSLKYAALRELSYEQFLWFFLAGIGRAEHFLQGRGVDPGFHQGRWLELYQRLLASQPGLAGQFEESPAGNPFFPELRPTELWFLELIPYLGQPDLFCSAKQEVSAIDPVQGEIARFLECSPKSWDFIYLSNIPEYIRTDALLQNEEKSWLPELETLFRKAARGLTPGGVVGWYVFHDPQRPEECLSAAEEIWKEQGFQITKLTIVYGCDPPVKSRFLNGLILAAPFPT